MKKYVLGILLVLSFLCAGCKETEQTEEKETQKGSDEQEEITVMHVDANVPEFQNFIEQAEKELGMVIHVLSYPENADNRQAKISTILAADEASVDIFSVNDEMVSEFKHKGYLEPLNDTVMTEELISKYPESYIKHISMDGETIYSVPYFMDIMVFWVNKSMTGNQEIATQEDFLKLLQQDFGENKYGYGGAWDSSYAYNELSQFINMFGGSYYDWDDEHTREALTFLHDLAEQGLVPENQVTDQYEQMEQKFIDGKYAGIFMYSGAMDAFKRAGVYREDKIQAVLLPEFREKTTNIATWQYVLNKDSEHKEAAIRFLKYVAGREGSIAYSEYMNRLPARLDIIREEELDIPGFQVLRDYVVNTELRERPLSGNTMEDITAIGRLFQQYVLNEISQEEFCRKAQKVTDEFL